MVEYCKEHGIAHEVCGKVVVALDDDERARLEELERRCRVNGVRVETVGPERLRELEPHAAGVAALHVLDTGIADYPGVCAALAREVEAAGGRLQLDTEVLSGTEHADRLVVETSRGAISGAAGRHVRRVAGGSARGRGQRARRRRGAARSSRSGASTSSFRPSARTWCARSSTRSPTRSSRSSACI